MVQFYNDLRTKKFSLKKHAKTKQHPVVLMKLPAVYLVHNGKLDRGLHQGVVEQDVLDARGEKNRVPPGSTDFTTSALVPLPVLAVELQEEIQLGIWNGPGGKDPVCVGQVIVGYNTKTKPTVPGIVFDLSATFDGMMAGDPSGGKREKRIYPTGPELKGTGKPDPVFPLGGISGGKLQPSA